MSDRKISWLVLFLLILSPFPGLAAAQGPDAEVDFFVESPEADKPLTVGDRITLRLEVKHPFNSQVIFPQIEAQWAEFEVLDQTAPRMIDNRDGMVTTGKDVVVTLFEPGQYQTPPLVVTHRKSDGAIEELAAPVIPLKITSVLTEDTELRDLKPQAEIPVPPVWPWVVAGLLSTMLVGSLLAGTGLWLYHRWQTRPLPAPIAPLPVLDTRPPEVIAHAELDRIEALQLPAKNQIKEHYTLVTNCLRDYIEGRYQIPALEQTTSELRQAFRQTSVPMKDVGNLMSLLSEGDLVKFARYMPQTEDINSLVNRARAVVDVTTPAPEPAVPVRPETEVVS